ncbi:hypothetical protein [Delftia acidovorans]|uniref:hypothetical protein n=1 Tax=Delftia acidovorans TaxID=80866 RepID=UPI00192C8093|nr:hypothetical protein [Delftia acidovorans]
MTIGAMSLAEMRKIRFVRPDLADIADRLMVASYDEFVEVLYRDLDSCVRMIEEDPKVRQDDSEDRLSTEIISMLRSMNYQAAHDELIGGHSDIVVRGERGYLWVGEAKIHTSYEKVMDGFDQLNSRYLRGTPNADQGALVIYIKNKNTANVIKNWDERMTRLGLTEYSKESCPTRLELGFYNRHIHGISGRKVRIRHIGINLCWEPD